MDMGNTGEEQIMSEYQKRIARQRKWMFYLLAVWVLGAGFTPYSRIFLGLLLGSSVSLYNLWMLQIKINDIAESIEKKRKAKGIGSISRFAAALFAVIIAIRFDMYFHMVAVLIGIMTSYIVIMIDVIIFKPKD